MGNSMTIEKTLDDAVADRVSELLRRLETAAIVLDRLYDSLCDAERLAAEWELSGDCTAGEVAEIRAAKNRAETAASLTAEFANRKEREREALRRGRW